MSATFNSNFIFRVFWGFGGFFCFGFCFCFGWSNYKDENLKKYELSMRDPCIISLYVQICIWSFQSYILQSIWILTHSLSHSFSLSLFKLHPYHLHKTDIRNLSKTIWITKRSIWNAFQMLHHWKILIYKLTLFWLQMMDEISYERWRAFFDNYRAGMQKRYASVLK